MSPTYLSYIRIRTWPCRPEGERLAITGGGSTAGLGRGTDARALEMTGWYRIIDYDPAELLLTVAAGTPLIDVQRLVGGRVPDAGVRSVRS